MLSGNNNLIPLRHFVKEGLYSQAYLSLLVQRKKLKAEKIGRNYFTTREWFEEYVNLHASKKIKAEKNQDNDIQKSGLGHDKAGFFVAKQIYYYLMAATAVFIVIFSINYLVAISMNDQSRGKVAGVEEMNSDLSTSSAKVETSFNK